jgi:hypothetical protein
MRLKMSVAVIGFITILSQEAAGGCTPNGNKFDLAPLLNAVGQYDESVAVLPGGGLNGADLVIGTALDTRALLPVGFVGDVMADAMYVQRDASDCGADLEGELPYISSAVLGDFEIFGHPIVVADPAHNAFFLADLRYNGAGMAVGLLKTTPAILLNTANCPNGTVANTVPCFVEAGQIANYETFETITNLFDPSIAVDQRTTGTGAGDVYVVSAQTNLAGKDQPSSLTLSACANSMEVCGSQITISGADQRAGAPWVYVQPNGVITVSFVNAQEVSPSSPLEIRFVDCTPRGAPESPTCGTPIAVLTENQPAGIPGEIQLTPQNINPIVLESQDPTLPKHVDRLESDGTTVTTFLVYDRCDVALDAVGDAYPLCPKTDVVVTCSTDGGDTWSPIQKVSAAEGQQLFGNIALDASTGTVNITYYSTENDPLKTRMQVFLAQILPGQTTAGTPQQITSSLYDGPLGGFNNTESLPGNYLGIAAGGTGVAGQSVVYIHFTGSAANGDYGGVPFPVINNVLTRFQY